MATIELVAIFANLRVNAYEPDGQKDEPLILIIVKAPEANHSNILAQQQHIQLQHLVINEF